MSAYYVPLLWGVGPYGDHLGLLQQSNEVALLSSLVCVGAGI